MSHLKKLTDLYFVQNRIQTIEGLEGLTVLRNLELAANRIRVCLICMLEGNSSILLSGKGGRLVKYWGAEPLPRDELRDES